MFGQIRFLAGAHIRGYRPGGGYMKTPDSPVCLDRPECRSWVKTGPGEPETGLPKPP
jgi:hypothetical protein